MPGAFLPRCEFDLAMDIIRAVRDAVGRSVDMLIEGHRRFNVATALEIAEAMRRVPAHLVRRAGAHHANISAMVEVARRSPVPIATGESFSNKQQFAELLKHDVVEYLAARAVEPGRTVCDAQDR